MAASKSVSKLVSHVIVDLDGTLLNTDSIAIRILKSLLEKLGKKWDSKSVHKIVGRTPLEAAAAVVEDYQIPYSAEEFLSMTTPLFADQWCNIRPLPGANRLIKHLRSNGVPMALASNSPKSNIETKISCHDGWKESFSVIVGGDEVEKGKPSPDIFLEAARRMNTEPSSCLVVEDSMHDASTKMEAFKPSSALLIEKKIGAKRVSVQVNLNILVDGHVRTGVTAGKAAGMEVIAVPSIPKQADKFNTASEVLNSLLDLEPEKWGLPPFEDRIEGTLPIEPWYIGGPVIKGFGRGSKVLGIPTANLSAESFSDILSEHTSGVYFGWAALSKRGIYKMVMSIGWNPYFDNTEKTIEPWLLHEFDEDFYGEELRLAIVGYIRPEANFPSLESLIARIHDDGRIAEKALDLPLYAAYKDSPYLTNPLPENNSQL